MTQEIKICSKCKLPKPTSEFHRQRTRKSGFQNRCKICHNEAVKKSHLAHRENAVARSRRYHEANKIRLHQINKLYRQQHSEEIHIRRVQRMFGLTPDDYTTLLRNQNEKCAVCRKPQTILNEKMCVDHDHDCCPGKASCGKCVRGLLCRTCNSLIGYAHDNADILRNAATYLDKTPTTKTT